jgi:hypothetical protein
VRHLSGFELVDLLLHRLGLVSLHSLLSSQVEGHCLNLLAARLVNFRHELGFLKDLSLQRSGLELNRLLLRCYGLWDLIAFGEVELLD